MPRAPVFISRSQDLSKMGLGQVKDIMSTCSIRVNKHSKRIMAPPMGYNNSEVPAVPPFSHVPMGPKF